MRTISIKGRKACPLILLTLAVLFLMPLPSVPQTTIAPQREQPPPPPKPDRPEPDRRPDSVGGGGIGWSIDLTSLFSRGAPDPTKVLNDKGPQFQDLYSMSYFSVQGFVKGNWPIVIDYELEQVSLVLITVAAAGIEPFYYRLDGTKIGRDHKVITIPDRFGNSPKPGWYFIRALSAGLGELRPVHLHLYGLGAGEKAVGSVGIDQLHLEPGRIRTSQREKTAYSFYPRSDFNEVEAKFLLVGLSSDHQIIAQSVKSEKIKGGVHRNKTKEGQWDGKRDNGKVSPGQHMLVVRAWNGVKSGGDWVSAWSRDLVRVE